VSDKWKQKLLHEVISYAVNFVYLAFFFTVFTWYRRLILDQYKITYLHYGFSVIEALILAKIIMIGDAMSLGSRLEHKPLIYVTLFKAFAFTIWVAVFMVIEHIMEGWMHGNGLVGGLRQITNQGKDELQARCLVVFFAFIPFFAFRETARVLGEKKLWHLFFRN
jgi:hypothetical protein